MIKSKPLRSQAGFTAVEAVMGVVLVAAVAAAGYFAYLNYSDNTSPSATASPTVTPTAKSAANQSESQAVIQAATNYCNAQVSSDSSKPRVLKIGTLGAEQVQVDFSANLQFARMNVNCHDASEAEVNGGYQYILKKVNAEWLVITEGQGDDPVKTKLYGVPSSF